jgi:hypothetical protein
MHITLAASGVTMDSKFDIFRRLPNGHPLWIDAVKGLEQAKEKMALEAANAPGEYFIFSEGNVVAKFGTVAEEQADAENPPHGVASDRRSNR